MDDALYDEFGNYIGPELDSDEQEEEDSEAEESGGEDGGAEETEEEAREDGSSHGSIDEEGYVDLHRHRHLSRPHCRLRPQR